MRLTPDTQIFNAVSRDSDNRRASDAAAFSRQAAISDAYNRSPAPVVVAASIPKQAALPEASARLGPEMGSQRREAPMGGRPKFVPKGQTINLLV